MKSCASLLLILSIPATTSYALKPGSEYAALPSDYGIIQREVSFRTPDSLEIKGWFYPAQDTAGIANEMVGRVVPVPDSIKRPPRPYKTTGERPRPTIVISDGDAGNMSDLILYAWHFFTRGYNVLCFDWRGFGQSSAWPTDTDMLCYSQFLTDYNAAIDFLKSQPEVDSSCIGLVGFSTGAYLSFAVAAERYDIKAYVGRALLTSFDDILPILSELNPARSFKAPGDYPRDLLPVNAASRLTVPVFLIVGENDNRTPPWMSSQIIGKLRGPKELWVVPGAGHGGSEAPEFTNYPEFFERVVSFYDRYLKKSPGSTD